MSNIYAVSVEGSEPRKPVGGIYSVPFVGPVAQDVHVIFDGLRPTEDDSLPVAVGKNALRYSTVVATGVIATAAAAVVVL